MHYMTRRSLFNGQQQCISIPYSQPLSDSESKGTPLIKNSQETYQIYQNCEMALQPYDTCSLI